MNIAVVGGGASGLTAAITAARSGADITIYDRLDRVGKKILATGNGRCNMTNMNANADHYYSSDRVFVEKVLNQCGVDDALEFFRGLGILVKNEDKGRIYPRSEQASAVLDVLRFEADRLGVSIMTGFEVTGIKQLGSGFEIASADGMRKKCGRVIVSAGGRAAPQHGTDGSGYGLLKRLGHTVTPVYPALVQLKTEKDFVRSLKGIKTDAKVTVIVNGKEKRSEFGELQFTDYGVSGIPIFEISPEVCGHNDVRLRIDLLCEYGMAEAERIIRERRGSLTLENLFVGILNKRLGQALIKRCGIQPLSRRLNSLSDTEIKKLVRELKALELKVEGTMSWSNAQATLGGINVNEVSPSDMQSRLVKGLYITGELLDVCGDCGGYNLQWAWSSGIIAGKAAALQK